MTNFQNIISFSFIREELCKYLHLYEFLFLARSANFGGRQCSKLHFNALCYIKKLKNEPNWVPSHARAGDDHSARQDKNYHFEVYSSVYDNYIVS